MQTSANKWKIRKQGFDVNAKALRHALFCYLAAMQARHAAESVRFWQVLPSFLAQVIPSFFISALCSMWVSGNFPRMRIPMDNPATAMAINAITMSKNGIMWLFINFPAKVSIYSE